MAPQQTQETLKKAALGTAVAFLLLLFVPSVPPNAALFGSLALFLLWSVVYFGGHQIYDLIEVELESRRGNEPVDDESIEEVQAIKEEYLQSDEMTTEELERRVEQALEQDDEEQNKETET